MLFSGALTALVTPFRNNSLDEATYRAFIEHQINAGIHGLCPAALPANPPPSAMRNTNGSSKSALIRPRAACPCWPGPAPTTPPNHPLARFAKKAGADGALLITPYYNKPTQEGLYQHYKAIAKAVDLPLVPYNVPGRTGCNLLPPTLARLAHDFSNIVGVKEATGDMSQASRILESCPEGFCVLSGDDFTALPLMALGGKGVISVTSNVAPTAWPPCATPSTRATWPVRPACTTNSSPCTRPCSWKATPSRLKPLWP